MAFIGFCILGIIGFFVFCMIYATIAEKKEAKEAERLRKEEEERKRIEREERRKKWESGKWAFPCEKFYKDCRKSGIKMQNLDDAFYFNKIMVIARNIIEKSGMDKEFIPIYCNEKSVRKYFETGHKKAQDRRRREEEKRQKQMITPQKGTLSPEQNAKARLFKELRDKFGREKREYWLKKEIHAIEKHNREIEKAQEAAIELETIVAASGHREPTYDWATLGGIATGLAGPAAGVSVATQAILKNQQIEANNQRNEEFARNLSKDLIRAAFSGGGGNGRILDEYKKELKDIGYKVVLDGTDTKELYEYLDVSISVEKNNETLDVIATFKSDYQPDVPDGVNMVMDGVLEGKIYCDSVLVSDVLIPLPLFGVGCNNRGIYDATTVSVPYFMMGKNRKYTVKCTPVRLWVMER